MSNKQKILDFIESLIEENDKLAKEGWYEPTVIAASDKTLKQLKKFVEGLPEEETQDIHTVDGEVVTDVIPNALSLKVEGLLPKDTPLKFGDKIKLIVRKED